MRFLRKGLLIGGVALLGVGVMNAADVPTGVVSDAVLAQVDGADAALGANVYAGDALNTHPGGTLRMRVGSGQLFMLGSSDASLTQDHGRIDMLMKRGTAGLSGTIDDPFEIDTPVGTLRPANDKHAFGQVTIAGASQIIVTSYEGTLSLTHDGEERMIEAGKAYRITLASEPASPAAPYPQGGQGAGTGSNHQRLIVDVILLGGAGAIGYAVWHHVTESPSNP